MFVGYTRKVKFADKKSAIETFIKHAGMLNDKLNVNISSDPLLELLDQLGGSAFEPIAKHVDFVDVESRTRQNPQSSAEIVTPQSPVTKRKAVDISNWTLK